MKCSIVRFRVAAILAWSALPGVSTAAISGECLPFGKLAPAFIEDLELDAKSAKIRVTPLDLAAGGGAERRGYLLANLAGCSFTGDCDSRVYLVDSAAGPKRCFREVATFRGRWKGVDRSSAVRGIASLVIDSKFEGAEAKAAGPVGIERRVRNFRFDPSTGTYGEKR